MRAEELYEAADRIDLNRDTAEIRIRFWQLQATIALVALLERMTTRFEEENSEPRTDDYPGS